MKISSENVKNKILELTQDKFLSEPQVQFVLLMLLIQLQMHKFFNSKYSFNQSFQDYVDK